MLDVIVWTNLLVYDKIKKHVIYPCECTLADRYCHTSKLTNRTSYKPRTSAGPIHGHWASNDISMITPRLFDPPCTWCARSSWYFVNHRKPKGLSKWLPLVYFFSGMMSSPTWPLFHCCNHIFTRPMELRLYTVGRVRHLKFRKWCLGVAGRSCILNRMTLSEISIESHRESL